MTAERRRLVYYVATSLDGFICGPGGEIDRFSDDPAFIAHYQERLRAFRTVVMGRGTYEFGYRFGLRPGDRAYPHMAHHVFSRTLVLPEGTDVEVVREGWVERVEELRRASETDIYVCGGAQFAGFLLENDLLDDLIVKVNPFTMGAGVPLFAGDRQVGFALCSTTAFRAGIIESHYAIAR